MTIDQVMPLVDELSGRYASQLEAGQLDLARAALEEAIGLLDSTLPGTSPDHPLYQCAALAAAGAYQERWQAEGSRPGLDAAISHARAGLAAQQPEGGAAVRADLRLLLADLLASRYRAATPDPADRPAVAAARGDRDEAIALLAAVREPVAAVPGDAYEADVCGLLGYLYLDRHRDSWPDPVVHDGDVTAAIAALTVTAGQPEPAGEDVAVLCSALYERYDRTKAPQDRDEFIRWGQMLLHMPGPQDPSDQSRLRGLVAMTLLHRAEDSTDQVAIRADTEAVIDCLEAELAVTPADAEDRAGLVALLAGTYRDRLALTSLDSADFDRKMDYARKAWELPAPDPEARAYRVMAGLHVAMEVLNRINQPGQQYEPGHADLAIDFLLACEQEKEAPGDAALRPVAVTLLARFQAMRAQVTGSAAALQEARRWILEAAREVSLADPGAAWLVEFLAGAIAVLALMGRSAGDLDLAISVLSVAVGRPSAEPWQDAMNRAGLGMTLVTRGQLADQPADLDAGISRLLESWQMLPGQIAGRGMVAQALSFGLMARYQRRGDAQDADAAAYYLTASQELADAGPSEFAELLPDANIVLAGTRGLQNIDRGAGRNDLPAIDEGIEGIRAVLAGLAPGHPYYPRLQSDLGLGLACRAARGADPARDAREAVDLLSAVLEAAAPDDVTHPMTHARLCAALGQAGWRLQDPRYLRRAVVAATAARAELPPGAADLARLSLLQGYAHSGLYQATQSRWDLGQAVRWLLESRRELSRRPWHPHLGSCLMELARCYRRQPDLARALEAGQAALLERSRDVLLQTGTARSPGFAQVAAAEAAEVARWCLAGGHPEVAVQALELGRGLILHSATAVITANDMLVQAGQHDLAAEWRAAPSSAQPAPWDSPGPLASPLGLRGGSGPPEIPADLRGRVLSALTQAGANPLLTPPACADIAEALTGTGADALVYLLEPADDGPGHAVIVPARSLSGPRAGIVPLPLLSTGRRSSPLTRYAQADQAPGLAAAGGAEDGPPADRRADREGWSEALDDLCGWAGSTVMGPLLGHVAEWGLDRLPQLVLVPVGRLSLVPWHAARLGTGLKGTSDYACARAVISYAASGRQLVEVGRRPVLPVQEDPVIVGDPAGDLVFGSIEAHFIRACCYPGGRYLGVLPPLPGARSNGPGRPSEVVRELPSDNRSGASVLHLGCHARLVADAPGQSYLELAGGEQLAIEAILRQASTRPAAAAGGLVCLAACSSAHGGSVHDEALSLSSAFLAAGASTVIGARWEVASGVTSVLMFMFHWFLAVEGQEPRDALRSAQLWLLDPDRTVPEQLPGELARFLPDPAGLAVADWAAFTHQGR